MKRIGIIILSIVFLYAGIASALEKCRDRQDHFDHLASQTHHESDSSLPHSHPSNGSSSAIPCSLAADRVDPLTETTEVSLPRPIDRGSRSHARAFLPILTDDFGQNSPFFLVRIIVFSSHAGIPRYLHLSVLRI